MFENRVVLAIQNPDQDFCHSVCFIFSAPTLVIYDNACTRQVYCLNRDPTFFVETVFRVDGLHFKNHKGEQILLFS